MQEKGDLLRNKKGKTKGTSTAREEKLKTQSRPVKNPNTTQE